MTGITNKELFALFAVPYENVRWQASAESEEYLALVSYLVSEVHRTA